MICTNGGIWWPLLCPGSQLFLSNDTFAAPNFVKLLRVLIVGGGGSGYGGDIGGGGGGYVACGNITLINGTTVSATVGAGGNLPSGGVSFIMNCNSNAHLNGQGRSQRGARGPGPPNKVLPPPVGLGRYMENFKF